MSISETVLAQVLDDQLRELSARILMQTSTGSYDHQGSGLLYLADDGYPYILTAAHVLEKFTASDPVYVQCYSAEEVAYPDEYMFSVPLDAVWTCYEGEMPTSGDGNTFDERDVAVIPLAAAEDPVRDWMQKRPRARFIPEDMKLRHVKGHGYGYPNYSGDNPCITHACAPVNKSLCCDSYTKKNHCIKWICGEKLADDERHGLSGSLIAMHGAASVILISVIHSTYPGHNGKVTFGTDLYWIRFMLEKHDVPIREANLNEDRDICACLTKIGEYLEEDCKTIFSLAAKGTALNRTRKDRYIRILEKVLGHPLKEPESSKLHCMDYGSKDRGVAVRIAASVSQSELRQAQDAFLSSNMHLDYPHIILMAMVSSAEGIAFPPIPEPAAFTRDIWDVPRLIREISGLPAREIQEIFLYLQRLHDTAQAVKKPMHQFPSVPNPSEQFVRRSRDEDIVRLEAILNQQDANPLLFISGIGGIGKTELAIQLAWYLKPDQGAYFLRYEVPDPEKYGPDMEAMKATILRANIIGHTRDGRTDEEEYQVRIKYLSEEYKGALLIVDNFDWQGKSFGDLRNETSYRDLTQSGIQVVFTTRYDLDNAPGYRIEPISEDDLLALMRANMADQYASEAELRKLIQLVKNHTLAVILMAKTLKNGNSLFTAADIEKLLKDGPCQPDDFPEVESDQNGHYKKDTLFGHLKKLLTPASLKQEEKEILGCLLLLPDQGMHFPHFIKSLVRNDGRKRNNLFNELRAKGWVSIDAPAQRVTMDPLLSCICRYELTPDPALCSSFLEGLWEHRSSLEPGDEKQLELAECFENAVRLVAHSAQTKVWKDNADEIRRDYHLSRSHQGQEVGT